MFCFKTIRLSVIALGLISAATADDPTFLVKQQAAQELVQKYIATSDWRLRLKIEAAEGFDETIATRIYRAFDLLSLNVSPNDNRGLVDAAWDQVNCNPKLSLHLLEPVIRERMSSAEWSLYGGKTYPPVRPERRDLFFSMCFTMAHAQREKCAADCLERLSEDADKETASIALQYLRMLAEPPTTHRGHRKNNETTEDRANPSKR